MELDHSFALANSTNSISPKERPISNKDMYHSRPSRRLLIFQEARNVNEVAYLPVNKLGLPICGPGPELPSILELPLRILRAFTEIFNQPKYKGWAVVAAGPYHDTSEEGKFYAVVLEQMKEDGVLMR
ncbi:uncharacterized protein ACLA_025070 [Aspergillus clavatus NRRL 1]|uniref:Uncharacterized protein n=1 Tax=Aspergillus clavatus (strain ATCC 1007 / CBS 513.65 / DSM 816 / NCTC 3887 / NRRL 1 / QM 1276 / 107) TaxID=344612 RepID=A1CQ69_ASPCL|nr:uncharacterized protein ACLA_025070 [Aspergillus clavatus NRRL 1]EAW07790.1 hypothetical protein ACLA_025070 [Aspergillus clavatus NRRL 1]